MIRRKRRPEPALKSRETAPDLGLSVDRVLQRAAQLCRTGQDREAERLLRRLAKQWPSHADVFGLHGTLKVQRRRYKEAVPLLRRALRLAPENASVHGTLAIAYEGLQQPERAIRHYRRALTLDPNFVQARANLGALLWSQGLAREAVEEYRKAVELEPNFAEAHACIAEAMHFMGDIEGALTAARRAVEANPRSAKGHYNLARALRAMGEIEPALRAYRQAIEEDPTLAEAYKGYVYGARVARDDPVVASLEQQLARDDIDPRDAACLHYARGKALDSLGEYDAAFQAWTEGARLRRQSLDFSIEATRGAFEKIKHVFTRAMFAAHHAQPVAGPTPIFIVGMPRSGTTLVEQIVASHPDVHGCGEVAYVGDLIKSFDTWSGSARPYPLGVLDVSDDALRGAAERYLGRVEAPEGVTHVTDKLPGNFQSLGLITLMMPNARIVHCCRNALDTAVSCFSTDFAYGLEWSYDLAEIGDYYSLYLDLMAHWRDTLPLKIHEAHYEAIVADLEGSARALLDYCGLSWDPHVLSFYEADRPVLTASSFQVRRSLYRTSVERWPRYDKHISTLRAHLPPSELI